jgi:hypothetical protein
VVGDPSSFLGLATTTVFELSDDLEQAELFGRLARGYIDIGDEASARSVAVRALSRARTIGDGEESLRIRLDLVPVFAVFDPAASVAILESVLEILDQRGDDILRASLIPRLISSALASGEGARFALREGIDLIYIILDPARRAQTLVEVATLYQQSGIGLSVAALIQQAIPAVRSITDTYHQVELFAELAVLADTASEQTLASRLIDIAVRVLRAADVAAEQSAQIRLVRAARILAGINDRAAVQLISDRLPGGYASTLVELELALLLPVESTRIARLEELAGMFDEAPDSADWIDARLRLAELAWQAGAAELSLAVTAAVQESVAGSEALQAEESLVRRLITLRVEQDEIEVVTVLMNDATNAYIRGLMAINAADALIANDRLALAEDFLVVGLLASDETTFLADSLRHSLVERFARAERIRLAIRSVERMDDPLFVARAVVSLAVTAEPAGLTTPLLRTDLASVLR